MPEECPWRLVDAGVHQTAVRRGVSWEIIVFSFKGIALASTIADNPLWMLGALGLSLG